MASIFDERNYLRELAKGQKISLRWYWLFMAIVVAVASVVGAVFQVLSYYSC